MTAYQLKVTVNNSTGRKTYFTWSNNLFGWLRISQNMYDLLLSRANRSDTYLTTSCKKYTWHTKVVYA